MARIGKIDTFDGSELWSSYQERLEQFFLANDVKNEKKVPVLLSVVGGRTYGLLRDLTSPAVPGDKTYDELTTILKSHFNPDPITIAERFRFYKRDQMEGESIRDFNASMRKLSEHCKFADLHDALKDRLVCGLRNESIQKRLLTEKDLTYTQALEISIAMETAAKDAVELQKHQSLPVNTVSTHSKSRGDCYRCKGTNHTPDECRFRNATCHKCKKKGHIERACLSELKGKSKVKHKKYKKKKLHTMEDTSSSDDEKFLGNLKEENVNNVKSDVIWLEPKIKDRKVKMELDTGSSVSIIPLKTYTKLFSNTNLKPSELKLRTYSGETILPKGKMSVKVEIDGQSEILDLHVVDGQGPALFGRDWLRSLRLDWSKLKTVYFTQVNTTINRLREKYPNIFKEELGTVKGIEARIKVRPDANPVFCKARPVPYAIKPKVEKELERLVDSGILSKVETSDWATPIVPVMKREGSVRICGDFKVTVNKVLEIDQYPLPKVEDIFASLAGGEKFTKLDLKNAYLQMEVKDEDKKYLTINTHKGLFRYNRLCFGIASAPAIWQGTMDQILQGLNGVKCILDDMIITGKDDQEHLNNLDKVLNRLDQYGLRLNADKCQFFMESLTFCGHKIDKEGLHKTEEKISAVVNAQTPENVSQLRAFLGLVNYYSRFLHNLATVLRPLHHLLEKNVPWKWNKQCTAAFEQVKEMITSDNVLVHYNPDLPVIVSCDASPYGLGAVLSHRLPNGDERPIAYASRSLTSAEKNYSQIDKEALGIVWGVKRFHTYLYGRTFTLVTDHQPLVSIFNPQKGIPATTAARLQRYALYLSGFTYTIQYKGTKSHGNADGLSRLPLQSKSNEDEMSEVDGTHVFFTEQFENLPVTCKEVRRATRNDSVLSHVYDNLMNGWTESSNKCTSRLEPYLNRKSELSVHQGCVLWGYRVVIPEKLRKRVLEEIHEGHMGIVKMKAISRSYVWWPGIDADLESMVKSCEGCLSYITTPPAAPVHPWEWPQRPWQRVHVDFAGPFEGSMFLLMIDAHSKWPEIIQMSTTTSNKTIEIMREVFSRYGIPECLVSDNGPQFVSEEFRRFMSVNGVQHITSAPYHPRTNGQVERLVYTFKQAMKASRKRGGSIQKRLSNFLLAYRTTQHSTTGESPSKLFFGRILQTRLSLVKPKISQTVTNEQQKMFKKNNHPARTFDVGEKVCVRDYRQNSEKWVSGTIVSKSGPLSYKVNVNNEALWRRHTDQIAKGNLQVRDTVVIPEIRGQNQTIGTNGTTPEVSAEQQYEQQQQQPTQNAEQIESIPPRRNPILGRWYISYFVNPCSWKGADKFTDCYYIFSRGKETDTIRACDYWRSDGECARNTELMNFTNGSIYSIKDTFGDVLTGKGIVVATDYKHFLIAWGCTRESPDVGFCLDPWLSLKTKKPVPSKRTLYIMDRILRAIWGIAAKDLVKVPQTGACDEYVYKY